MKKSKDLIPLIQEATTKDEAVQTLMKIVEALHLSQNYYHLVDLKDKMTEHQQRFKEIWKEYKSIPQPRTYEQLHQIRIEVGFLHTQANDDLAFEVNKSKIYHEERKSEARAAAMLGLKEDKDFQSKIKTTSASALRDMMGASPVYQEFVTLASMSYGLYQEFLKLMESLKMLNDSVASECRYAQDIEKTDRK